MFGTQGHGKFGAWRLLGHPQVIEYDNAVLTEIASAVVQGFHKFPRGGVEVGGVLFGQGDRQLVRILAHLPIECEHASGPSFHLSEADHDKLARLLQTFRSDPGLADLIPVGWYRSHTRSGLEYQDSSRELHDRHFPDSWHISIVFRPDNGQPIKAGIFVRGSDGKLPDHPTLAIAGLGISATPLLDSLQQRDSDDAESAGAGAADSKAGPPAASEREEIPVPFAATLGMSEPVKQRKWKKWAVGALALTSFAAGAWGANRWLIPSEYWAAVNHYQQAAAGHAVRVKDYWVSALAPTAAPDLALRTFADGKKVLARWDPDSEVFRDAVKASVAFRGGDRGQTVDLEPSELYRGSVTCEVPGDEVAVKMEVFLAGGSVIAEHTRFVGSRSAQSPAMDLQELQEAAKTQAEIENLRRSLRMQTEESRALAETLNTLRQVAATRAATPVPSPAPPVVIAESAPVLQQKPPPAATPTVLEQRAPAQPPGAPAPETPQPSPSPPAPPKATSGKLIWTGYLREGQTLTIEDGNASLGSLSGRLPGTAVGIIAYPAELTSEGLTVYSSQSKHSGQPTVSPPGPENAWNRVVYRYEPESAQALEMVEAPSAANGWSRMEVRANGKPLTVVMVEWAATP